MFALWLNVIASVQLSSNAVTFFKQFTLTSGRTRITLNLNVEVATVLMKSTAVQHFCSPTR